MFAAPLRPAPLRSAPLRRPAPLRSVSPCSVVVVVSCMYVFVSAAAVTQLPAIVIGPRPSSSQLPAIVIGPRPSSSVGWSALRFVTLGSEGTSIDPGMGCPVRTRSASRNAAEEAGPPSEPSLPAASGRPPGAVPASSTATMADIPPPLLPVVRRMGKFMSEYEHGSDAHRQALKLDGLRAASSSLHQLATLPPACFGATSPGSCYVSVPTTSAVWLRIDVTADTIDMTKAAAASTTPPAGRCGSERM